MKCTGSTPNCQLPTPNGVVRAIGMKFAPATLDRVVFGQLGRTFAFGSWELEVGS
jgi:hypothetical protein